MVEMVLELSNGLSGIKHEQEYMEVRERIHRMSMLTIIVNVNKLIVTLMGGNRAIVKHYNPINRSSSLSLSLSLCVCL